MPFGRSGRIRPLEALALVSSLLLFGGGVRAQNDSSQQPPPEPSLGTPLDSVTDYSSWTTHVASKPEDAIVLVRYASAADATPAATTGLIIRCDGFVLVPRAARDTVRMGGWAHVLLLHADGGKVTKPTSVPALPHPNTHPSVGYSLIKINGYHTGGLPLLDSRCITAGTPVHILWAVAGGAADSDGFSVASRDATITTEPDRFGSLSLSVGGHPPTDIPAGAVIVDAKSGGALGIETAGGESPQFSAFTRFHVIASEIGIAPSRDAVRLGGSRGTPPGDPAKMVWVPGGPMRLPPGHRLIKLYGTDVVCTPGFYADAVPVTNGEYRHWLSTYAVRNIPAIWSPNEVQYPTRADDIPVTSMLREDAAQYAFDRSARLLTEVEWTRASYIATPTWAFQRDKRWNDASADAAGILHSWNISQEEHFFQSLSDITQSRGHAHPDPNALFMPASVAQDIDRLKQDIAATFGAEPWPWRRIHPVGAYADDISAYQVRDVVSNPIELLQYDEKETFYSPKFAPAMVDPTLTIFEWKTTNVFNADTVQQIHDFYQKVFDLLLWHDQWGFDRTYARGRYLIIHPVPVTPDGNRGVGIYCFSSDDPPVQAIDRYQMRCVTRCYPCFRCAR